MSRAMLKVKAEQGDIHAQCALGMMVMEGLGGPRDVHESLKWFRMSAEAGNPEAQFQLGTLYLKGLGVPRNGQQAVHWLTRAAQRGVQDAVFNLGLLYLHGATDVKRNPKLAEKWLFKSVEYGDIDAQVLLRRLREWQTPVVA